MLSSAQVAAVSGASYRQLDYWARFGSLRPAVPADGSGSRRRYTVDQAKAAAVLTRLSMLGCEGASFARAGRSLKDGEWSGVIFIDPTGEVSAHRTDGWCLDVDAIHAEVEAALAELPDAVVVELYAAMS